jgi:hypothetical protein
MTFTPEDYAEPAVRYTPRKTVLKGVFELSKAAVPFFLANLTLEDLQRELKLVEELPADYRANWRLEELFQRDIDWDRVSDQIVNGYLKRKEKRTFFNALTVALLPISQGGVLDDRYGTPDELPPNDPPFGLSDYSTLNIGGVQLASRKSADSDVAYLRWNERTVFAATIDGQHRLAALKTFAESTVLTRSQRATKIPVIFLILDERVGFHTEGVAAHGDSNPLLSMVREVFIDLNKHALEVSVSRQVLLDDQEVEARCTRTLIAQRIGKETYEELPLGLVNWKDDVAKFDLGPYFTSVYVLYLVVKDILSIYYPKDPLEETEIRRFVSSIEDRLQVSSQIESADGPHAPEYKTLDPLQMYVDRHHLDPEDPSPFRALPYAYGSAAIDSFLKLYKPLIVGVFRHLTPYRAFWELSASLGGIDGDLAFYLAQNKRTQKQLREDVWGDEEFRSLIEDPIKELENAKRNEWAFMVVFQKALIRATVDSYFQGPVILGEEVAPDTYTQLWVDYLNRCHEQGLLLINALLPGSSQPEDHLWEGIAKAPVTHNIKYTNPSVGRIRDLLILWWYNHRSDFDEARDFLGRLTERDSNEVFPEGEKCASRVRNALRAVVKLRHASALESAKDEEEYARLVDSLAEQRLLAILQCAP